MATWHTIKQIEAALRNNDGQPSLAARELGVSRQAIHERIKRSPALQTVVTDIDSELLEIGKGQIAKAMRAGDMPTVRWFMERKGRDLGYGKQSEVIMSDVQIEGIVQSFSGDVEKLRAFIKAVEGPPARGS